jgi:hypothetical protein
MKRNVCGVSGKRRLQGHRQTFGWPFSLKQRSKEVARHRLLQPIGLSSEKSLRLLDVHFV